MCQVWFAAVGQKSTCRRCRFHPVNHPMNQRSRLAAILVASALLALGPLGCPDGETASDGTAGGPGGNQPGGGDATAPKPVTDPSKFSVTTLTGFVFDAVSGKPVHQATVSTDPPTENVQTTSTGLFSISVGHAFGVITLKASAEGFRQQLQTCVNLKPGLNSIADISLVKTTAGTEADCQPPCTGATTCISGVCISACNPLCGCGEICDPTAATACSPDPNFVSSAICGKNSHPLGQTVCECDLGYVAAGDGSTCIKPAQAGECPSNATPTDTGCECDDGYLPDAAGQECIPEDEAATPDTLKGDGKVTYKWPTPGPAPRGIAYDGKALWVGDAATQLVYRLQPADGKVLKEYDIGVHAKALRDLTFGDNNLYMTVTSTAANPQAPALLRLDPTSGTIKTITTANNFQRTDGLTFDGTYLDSIEGLVIKRRSADLGGNVFPTNVVLTSQAGGQSALYTPVDGVRFLAYTHNQFVGWVGTRYDGGTFIAEFVTLNAVHKTTSAELGRLEFDVGGSHLAGIETFGSTMWMVVAGSGKDTPKVVEVQLD